MKRIICGVVLLTAALSFRAQSTPLPSITAIPSSGSVSGQPGSVVGWGLTLVYTAAADWVVLNDSYFTGATTYGTYQDYVVNQLIVAGPAPESSTVTVPYSHGATGLGEFDIGSFAPPNVSITGDINVDYSIFSEDPNSPTFDPGSFVASGTASIPVAIHAVPEPGSFGLIVLAGLVVGLGRRVRTARSFCAACRLRGQDATDTL